MNNMKLIKPFVIGMVSLSLIGCNNEPSKAQEPAKTETTVEENKDTEKVKEDTTKKEENTAKADETKKEDTKASDMTENKEKPAEEKAQATKDVKYEERDGSYISTLLAQNNGDSEISETVSDVKTEGDTLMVTGKLDYREKPDSTDKGEILEDNTYNFKINENTKFQAVGGLAEPETYTAEEFNDFYKDVKESGLALIIRVQNGIATEVNVSS